MNSLSSADSASMFRQSTGAAETTVSWRKHMENQAGSPNKNKDKSCATDRDIRRFEIEKICNSSPRGRVEKINDTSEIDVKLCCPLPCSHLVHHSNANRKPRRRVKSWGHAKKKQRATIGLNGKLVSDSNTDVDPCSSCLAWWD